MMTYTIKDFTDLFLRETEQINKRTKKTKEQKLGNFQKIKRRNKLKKKSAMYTYVVSKNKIKKKRQEI